MTRIVGISGSPRTGGNTELLVKEALGAAAEENVQTEFISLAGKRIEPCDACGSCERARRCHIEDDFEAIYARVEDADGIIIGSPVYFGSATPQVKALIDRAGCIQGVRGDRFKGKVGGPIVVARRAGQNFALAQLLFFFLIMEMWFLVPSTGVWHSETVGEMLCRMGRGLRPSGISARKWRSWQRSFQDSCSSIG